MLKREDFENPIDWVIYKVNGKRTSSRITENYTFPQGKYQLKFYNTNSEGRYNVQYGQKHICTCGTKDVKEIQTYFDKNFNGKNIDEISQNLKLKYNNRIRHGGKRGSASHSYRVNALRFGEKERGRFQVVVNNKGKTHTICHCNLEQMDDVIRDYNALKMNNSLEDVKTVMKKKYNLHSPRTHKLKRGRVTFDEKPTGRVQVRLKENGKSNTLCSCYPSQKDEVLKKYYELRDTHSLEDIQKILKRDYNLKIRGVQKKHQISVTDDGAVYKDGKYVCVNDQLYKIIEKLI